jgi:LCP family protein required for cell wall assembly
MAVGCLQPGLHTANGIIKDFCEAGMSKKHLIVIIASICVLVGVVLGAWYGNKLMDKPLGPSLKSASTQLPLFSLIQQLVSTQKSTPRPVETPVPGETPDQALAEEQSTRLPTLCGQTPILTILAVGTDFEGDNYLYGLADVIRIVRVDFTTHTVSVLTLDRAIWVDIPGISGHYGITQGALNQSYFYGVPAMGYYDGPGGGAGLLAATLKTNFDLDVDNYVVGDMGTFVKLVDTIDGIDVYLPEPVDGSPYFESFNAGKQHLTGKRALELARIREKYSTLIRDRNQSIVLQGLYNKLTSPAIIVKIPQLAQVFKNAGLTDLSPRQIENLVCILKKMGGSDLTFREIPEKYYVDSWVYSQDMKQDLNVFKVDFDVFRSYIRQFMQGQWAQE